MTIRLDAHGPAMHRAAPPQLPVRCASTANLTIATGLNAGDTVDGITLAAGDRVLLKDQSAGAENGIYIAGASPVRADDMAEGVAAWGAVLYVIAGTTNGGTIWRNTNTSLPTIDTTALTFSQFTAGGVTDHGALTGLADDDHPQYATNTEFDDHNARHESGGADAIKLDDLAAPDDNTDLDVSIAKHGLAPKLPNDATKYLDGTGAYTVPAGSGNTVDVEDEGSPEGAADTIDFVGAGVSVTFSGGTATVDIPGGGGGGGGDVDLAAARVYAVQTFR